MHVRFSVTGPDAAAVRVAVTKQLASLDAAAQWSIELDVSPAVRADGGGLKTDWSGEVTAWDGREEPPAHLRVVGDEANG